VLLTKSCVVCYQCCWLSRVLFFTSLLLAKSWVVCCLLPMFCWLNRVFWLIVCCWLSRVLFDTLV